jgi:hypothetical protein
MELAELTIGVAVSKALDNESQKQKLTLPTEKYSMLVNHAMERAVEYLCEAQRTSASSIMSAETVEALVNTLLKTVNDSSVTSQPSLPGL